MPTVVRLGYYEDETSELAQWHIPQAHFLEQWGDARTADGIYNVIQPMILPLFGGYSDIEILNLLLGHAKDDKPDTVRATFNALSHGGSGHADLAWNAFLRDGFLPGSAAQEIETANFNVGGAVGYLKQKHTDDPFPAALGDGMEVVLISDYKVDDGRYANNGWLQEMPHPITKICWDNAALMSPNTARKLGVNKPAFDTHHNGAFREGDYTFSDFVEIEIPGGRKIKAPVLVSPGHADNSVSIALGYGRRVVGRVGHNTGFDAYPLRTAATTYFATGRQGDAGRGHLPARDDPGPPEHGRPQPGARTAHRDVQAERGLPLRRRPLLRRDDRHGRPPAAEYFALQKPAPGRAAPVGHGYRSEHLHGLQRVRGCLPVGEQHSRRRQGPGVQGPRDALDAHRPLLFDGRERRSEHRSHDRRGPAISSPSR